MSGLGNVDELEQDLIKRNREIAKLRDELGVKKKTIHEWEIRHTEMNTRMSELEANANRALAEKERVENDIKTHQKQMEEHKDEMGKMKQFKETMQSERISLAESEKKSQAEKSEAIKNNETLKAQLSVAQNETKEFRDSCDSLREEIQCMTTEVGDLKNQLRRQGLELEKVRATDSEFEDLRSRLDSITKARDALSVALDEEKTKSAQEKVNTNKIKEERMQLRDEIEQLKKQVKVLSENESQLKDRIATIDSQYSAKLAAREATIAEKVSIIDKNEATIAEKLSIIDKNEATIAEKVSIIDKNTAEIEQLNTQHKAQLESIDKTLKDEIAAHVVENDKISGELKQAEAKLTDAQQKLEELQGQYDQKSKERDSAAQQLASDHESALRKSIVQFEEKERALSSLQEEFQQLRANRDAQQKQLENKIQEHDTNQQKMIKEKKQELSNLEEQLATLKSSKESDEKAWHARLQEMELDHQKLCNEKDAEISAIREEMLTRIDELKNQGEGALQQKQKESESKINEIQLTLQEKLSTIRELEQKIDQIKADADRVATQIKEKNDEITQCRQLLQEKEDCIEKLNTTIANFKQIQVDFNAEKENNEILVKKMEAKEQNLNAELEQIKQQNEDLKTELSQTNQNIDVLKAELQQINQDSANLKTELERTKLDNNDSSKQMEIKLVDSQNDANELRAALEQKKIEINECKAAFAKKIEAIELAHKKEVNLKQATIEKAEQEIEHKVKEMERLLENLENKSNEHTNINQQHQSLRGEFDEVSEKCTKLETELQTSKDEVISLKNELHITKTELMDVQNNMESSTSKCDNLKNELDKLNSDSSLLKSNLENLKNENDLLKSDFEKLQKEKTSIDTDFQIAQQKADDLEQSIFNEITTLQSKIDTLTTERKEIEDKLSQEVNGNIEREQAILRKNAEINELETQKEEQFNELQSALEDNAQKLQLLQVKDDALQQKSMELVNLEDKFQKLKSECAVMVERETNGTETNQKLQKRIAIQDEELAALRSELDKEGQESDRKDNLLKNSEEQISNFLDQVQSISEEKNALTTRVEDLDILLKQARDDIEMRDTELQARNVHIDELKADYEAKEFELQEQKHTNEKDLEKKTQEYEAKIQKISHENHNLQEINSQQKDEIFAFNNEKSLQKQQILNLEQKIKDAESSSHSILADKSKEIDDERHKYASCVAELDAVKRQCTSLESEKSDLMSHFESIEERNSSLESNNRRLENELNATKQEIRDLLVDHEEATANARKLKDLNSKYGQNVKAIERKSGETEQALERQVTQLFDNLEQTKSSEEKLRSELLETARVGDESTSRMRNDLEQKQLLLQETQLKLQNSEAECERLRIVMKDTSTEAERELKSLSTRMKLDADLQINSLKSDLDRITSQNTDYQKQIENFKLQIRTYEEVADQRRRQSDDLESNFSREKADLELNLSRERTKVLQLKDEYEQRKIEITDLNFKLTAIENERDDCNRKIKAQDEQLQEYEKEKKVKTADETKLRSDLSTLENEKKILSDNLKLAETKVTNLTDWKRNVESEKETVVQKNKEIKLELHNLKQSYAELSAATGKLVRIYQTICELIIKELLPKKPKDVFDGEGNKESTDYEHIANTPKIWQDVLKRHKENIKFITQERDSMRKEIKELRDRPVKLDESVDEGSKNNLSKDLSIADMRTELEKNQQTLSLTLDENAKLRSDIKALQISFRNNLVSQQEDKYKASNQRRLDQMRADGESDDVIQGYKLLSRQRFEAQIEETIRSMTRPGTSIMRADSSSNLGMTMPGGREPHDSLLSHNTIAGIGGTASGLSLTGSGQRESLTGSGQRESGPSNNNNNNNDITTKYNPPARVMPSTVADLRRHASPTK